MSRMMLSAAVLLPAVALAKPEQLRMEAMMRTGVDAKTGTPITKTTNNFRERRHLQQAATPPPSAPPAAPAGPTCAQVQASYNEQGCCGADSQEFAFGSLTNCPGQSTAPAFAGNGKNSLFDQLSPQEYQEITDYLYNLPELNIPCKYMYYWFANDTASTSECKMPYTTATWNHVNWVSKLQVLPPNKTEALAYLDGSGPRPARYARFHFMRGARSTRDSVVMKVGPLPISTATTVTQMTEMTVDGQIPWDARPYDGGEEFFIYGPALSRAMTTLAPLVANLTDQVRVPGHEPQLIEWTYPDHTASAAASSGAGSMRRVMNGHFWFKVLASDSPSAGGVIKPFPLTFSYVMDYSAASPAEWPIYNLVYCNQGPYPNAAALLAAWQAGTVQSCRMEVDYYQSTLNTMRPVPQAQTPGGTPMLRPTPGDASLLYTPGGSRIATQGQAVEWMGWAFHVDVNQITGLTFFDIKFKGERIVYEMKATDFAASYSSARQLHNLYYSDGGYAQGMYTSPLKDDVDCPKHAIYFDRGLSGPEWGGEIAPSTRTICIFEAPENTPLFRHYSSSYTAEMDQYRGLPSTILIVRSIIAIGNYDYVQHATFYLDGKLKYEKSASGYSLGVWDQDFQTASPAFGQHFTNQVTGTLHLHQAAWKVDIDIGEATSNALQKTKLEWGTYEQATGEPKPAWITGNGVLYANKTIQQTEAGYFKKDYNQFDIVSTTQTNRWGEKRGYEIYVQGSEKQYFPADHPLLWNMNYTKYNVAVVKRKEEEPEDNSQNYCYFHPAKAPSDIGNMLDGEDISSTDVVAYLSATKLHYPRAEDVPMPAIFTGGFMLKPHNFFDRGAYSDLPNTYGTTTQCTMP